MPNPKTGTVTDDVSAGVKAAMAGRVEFRMDRTGNVSVPAGKLSFEPKKLEENILTIVKTIRSERPASVKGVFIRSITISSTMGVGVPVVHQADAE
jgi:large subunit ribosomal protein L1